ncbi:MAG TPA: UDP-N-acetylglucosamine 1-carboxyvinyltransferase [Chloroflexota bacterium]|nr:UDP-N-acetylglucosamine 1-carboxyvinyltransferase [Chloroflexota bacterium]
MSRFVIDGGRPLNGEIEVEANKNAVLPMMAATLLTDDDCVLNNVPRIADVATMSAILDELGAHVEKLDQHTLLINCAGVTSFHPPAALVEKLRASIVLMGPLLSRFGRANMHHPGGDAIGTRSIGTHLHALERLGATFTTGDNLYHGHMQQVAGDRNIFLDEASVTATENAMMLAASQPRCTTIRNAACEPHIVNLAAMLRGMGAEIDGAGSNVIHIRGAGQLRGVTEQVWPDHIEAGTFVALAAAARGTVTICNVIPEHLEMVFVILDRMGVDYTLGDRSMTVRPSELKAVSKIQTGIWPGFPTDLASIFIVLATQATGMTLVHDWMYEGRMFFVDRLTQMGASIVLADPHRAVISGPTRLRGREIVGPDIRAGIALVMAALIAEGRSEIEHIELIDRGYERIDQRLTQLGASIERIR